MDKMDSVINEIKQQFDEGVWANEHKYKWIKLLAPKVKGAVAEKIYSKFCEKSDYVVEKPVNSDHDCIVNGQKDEVKLSTIEKSGKTFTFFQIRQFQDYENIIFISIQPDDIQIWKIKSSDFMDYIEKNPKEQVWAGGKTKKVELNSDIRKNDLFHWVKPVNKDWPSKSTRLS